MILDEDKKALVTEFIGLAKGLAINFWKSNARDLLLEDIVSEALYALTYAASLYDPSRRVPFGAYAAMVIRHRLPQVCKSLRRWRRDSETSSFLEEVLDSGSNSAEEVIFNQEVLALLPNLPPRWLGILTYYYINGKTLEQISEIESISKQRVHQLIVKALKSIRIMLKLDQG